MSTAVDDSELLELLPEVAGLDDDTVEFHVANKWQDSRGDIERRCGEDRRSGRDRRAAARLDSRDRRRGDRRGKMRE